MGAKATLDDAVKNNFARFRDDSRIIIVEDFSGASGSPDAGLSVGGILSSNTADSGHLDEYLAQLGMMGMGSSLIYSKPNRREFMGMVAAFGLLPILQGCATVGAGNSGSYSRHVLNNFFEHLRKAPYFAAGIDWQFDGYEGHNVYSPTWGWVMGIADEPGRKAIEILNPNGLQYQVAGLKTIYVARDQWITPATLLGIEGNNAPKADGGLAAVHTHEDVRGHGDTHLPKSRHQVRIEPNKNKLQIYDPDDESEIGNAYSNYDGRKKTVADIVGPQEKILNEIGDAHTDKHGGKLIKVSQLEGMRFDERMDMLDAAIMFGLIEPKLQELLAGVYSKRQKGGFWGPYSNPILVKEGVYDNKQSHVDSSYRNSELDKVESMMRQINEADRAGQFWVQIDTIKQIKELAPVSADPILSWHLARPYQNVGARDRSDEYHIKAIVHWLTAYAQSNWRWPMKFVDEKSPLKRKDKFTWQFYDNMARIYSFGLEMPEVAYFFGKKATGLHYTGPK